MSAAISPEEYAAFLATMRRIESIAAARNQLCAQLLTLREELAGQSPDEIRDHADYAHLTHINARSGTISLEAQSYSGYGSEYYVLTSEQLTDPNFETTTRAEIIQAEAELADKEGREEARLAALMVDFEVRERAQYARLAEKYGPVEDGSLRPGEPSS